MINLINEKQKKILTTEYTLRLFTVCLFILSLIGLFMLAYIVPYYLSVLNSDIIVSKQLESAIEVENKENIGENVSQIILRTNEQIKAVEELNRYSGLFSQTINGLVSEKNGGIKINRFVIKFTGREAGSVVVNGVARDRQGLVAFISALKNHTEFSDVESPVSDFAKQAQIPFTINLKIKI